MTPETRHFLSPITGGLPVLNFPLKVLKTVAGLHVRHHAA